MCVSFQSFSPESLTYDITKIWLVSFSDAPGPTLMMILQVQHQQGHIRSCHCQNTWFPTGFPPGLAETINLCRCKLSKFSEQWPFFFSSINSPTERNTLWKIKTENTKKQSMTHVAFKTCGKRHNSLLSHNGKSIFAPQHHHTLHLRVQYGTNPEVSVARSHPLSGGWWKSFWELWEISSRAEINEAGWRNNKEVHLPQFVAT